MNASPFSAHKDVLDAPIPSDEDAKQRLFTECKSRATSAVKASIWPDAASLYQKAVDCSLSPSDAAICQSNLSLVQGKMNLWDKALEAAQKSTELDAGYVKGWWRKGQAESALKKYEEAVQSIEEGLKLDTDNKALQKELTKQKSLLEAANKAKEEESNKMDVDEPPPLTKTAPSSGTSKKSSDSSKLVDIDGTDFTKSDAVRGYKIVNGKKTSYFHNELSEDAAKLIGNIAPKKLDSVPTPSESTPTSGSAWNKAGTWEEKDVTAWAIGELQTALLATTFTFPDSSPAPGAVVTCTKAKITGNASFATVRGKKRYIYELCCQLEWNFEHEDQEANGKLALPDVDGTCALGEGYEEAEWSVEHSDDANLRPLLETFVRKQGWRDVVHTAVDDWVRKFKDTY